jgi:hypothetical protein
MCALKWMTQTELSNMALEGLMVNDEGMAQLTEQGAKEWQSLLL